MNQVIVKLYDSQKKQLSVNSALKLNNDTKSRVIFELCPLDGQNKKLLPNPPVFFLTEIESKILAEKILSKDIDLHQFEKEKKSQSGQRKLYLSKAKSGYCLKIENNSPKGYISEYTYLNNDQLLQLAIEIRDYIFRMRLLHDIDVLIQERTK